MKNAEAKAALAKLSQTAAELAFEAWAADIKQDNLYEQLMASLDALHAEYKATVEKHTRGLH